MQLVIRRVDVADAVVKAAIDSMIAECFVPSEWVGDTLPKAQTGYWWVAFDAKTPVGFASMRPSVRTPDTGYLSVSGVLKSHRGKGIQKRLIMKRVQFARTLGWHTVISDTMHDNVASMRSLLSCGFRPFTPSVKWSGSPNAVYWMRPTEARFSA